MTNDTLTARTDDDEVVEILEALVKWRAARVRDLRAIADSKGAAIEFEGPNGQRDELPENMRAGFVLGIKVALGWLGKLPLQMERSATSD